MCADCGCGKPKDDHGDDRHILYSDIEAAAKASGISVLRALSNMKAMALRELK